jgi:cysteine desulfurase
LNLIYMDHAATTPVHPEVTQSMLPFFEGIYGNPSSVHALGRDVKAYLDRARREIANSIHASPHEIVFTSGGTEADNMAIIGVAMANKASGNHIITTGIEHHAVLYSCQFLESSGFEVTYLPVDMNGRIRLEDLEGAIRDTTILISLMFGNNEVGSIQPIQEAGDLARARGIYLHTDAVQAYGMIPIDTKSLQVDLLSLSAHKINGPKGIGALYISRQVKISPYLFGGTQEKKRRAGTENVPGIIGFAKAAEISQRSMDERGARYLAIREAMLSEWSASGIEYHVNGHATLYLPHILNVSFPGVDTEVMLMNLDMAGISCASGSACTSGALEVSHVLQAMCLGDPITRSAVRFSFGLNNTVEQAILAANKVVDIVRRIHR